MSRHADFMMKAITDNDNVLPTTVNKLIAGNGFDLLLRQLFYYSPAKILGYDFQLLVEGQDAGIITVLIDPTLDVVREAGNIGVEIRRPFYGMNLPLNATIALLPLFREHDMKSILITCDKGNAAVRKACEDLGAQYLDMIDTADGTPHKDRFLWGNWYLGEKVPLMVAEVESNAAELIGELSGLCTIRAPYKYLFIDGNDEDTLARLRQWCKNAHAACDWAVTTYFVIEIPKKPILPSAWTAYAATVNTHGAKLEFAKVSS